ncbi:MAG: ComF family protein [Lachnospiraceae bacterium]|nr:ComF family protein [Lachnospiraceae bacterium]
MRSDWRKWLTRKNNALINDILDLLYPPRCPVCDRVLPFRSGVVCASCLGQLPYVGEEYCLKCGKPLRKKGLEYCNDCSRMRHVFEENRALFYYDDRMKRSLYRLKYAGRREYADTFARLAAQELGDWIGHLGAELIIPVPLHKSRLRKRGYNQAALFAKSLSSRMHIPYSDKSAGRIRATLPQKGLNPAQRQENLKKAFIIRQNDVKSKIVLLVDDIYTTGSTLDALAGEILAAGARNVYGLTICIGRDGGREELPLE